jgi:hypothetical protein
MPDASLEWYTGTRTQWIANVTASGPGVCHIVLTFATGFTYSTDATFAEQPGSGCGCPSLLGPTSPAVIRVNNPSNTCVSLGADSGAKSAIVILERNQAARERALLATARFHR